MPNFLKKLIISIFVVVSLLVPVFTPIVYAQQTGTWYDPTYQYWNNIVFDKNDPGINGERFVYFQVKSIIFSLAAIVTGSGSNTVACLMANNNLASCIDDLKKDLGALNTSQPQPQVGALQTIDNTLSQVPISGVYYFKNTAQRLHLIPEAQAQQGAPRFGDPILNLWRAVRNITYALFIIIIVVMAFMIMFRVKISPQTVITVQSALPQIVIGLILVTFSYAIAGLLVDFMYVIIGLVTTIFKGSVLANTTDWSSLFNFLTNGPANLGVFGLITIYFGLFNVVLIAALGQAFFSGSLSGIFLGGIAGLLFPIILVVIGVVLLIAMIRLLWLLFVTFVNIILLVITAPFSIALGTIVPASGFGSWIKSLISHLVVYPIVGSMFILAYMFLISGLYAVVKSVGVPFADFFINLHHGVFPIDFSPTILGGSIWAPPLTAGTQFTGLLYLGLSFVLVILTPQVANMIKAIIQGQPFAYGTAIGQAFGPARLAGGFAGGGLTEYLGTTPPAGTTGLRADPRFIQAMNYLNRAGQLFGIFPKTR